MPQPRPTLEDRDISAGPRRVRSSRFKRKSSPVTQIGVLAVTSRREYGAEFRGKGVQCGGSVGQSEPKTPRVFKTLRRGLFVDVNGTRIGRRKTPSAPVTAPLPLVREHPRASNPEPCLWKLRKEDQT
uniref:Uncharacterized protein n=1 Tax=Pipistrellus kuhlii TaxID=59472 RepID=A0A7J7Y954_PIPKU|nr:hypothetical protein mPipKuh1_010304 [Pipistrellus kuhlii]